MTTLTDILNDMTKELQIIYRRENLTDMQEEERQAVVEDYADKVRAMIMKIVE